MGGQGGVEERQVLRSGCRRSGPPTPPTDLLHSPSLCLWLASSLSVRGAPSCSDVPALSDFLRLPLSPGRLCLPSCSPQCSHCPTAQPHLQSASGTRGLPWWLSWQRICLQCRRPGFNPWVGKIPWRREWQPIPVSLLENPMDRGAWWATVHQAIQT